MKILKFLVSIAIWPLFVLSHIKSNLLSNWEQLSSQSSEQFEDIPSGKKANRSILLAGLILPLILLQTYLVLPKEEDGFMPSETELIMSYFFSILLFTVILRYTFLRKVIKETNAK